MTATRKSPEALHVYSIPDDVFVLMWQRSSSTLELASLLGIPSPSAKLLGVCRQRAWWLRKLGVKLKKLQPPREDTDIDGLNALLASAFEQDMTGSLSDARAERRYEELFDAGMTSAETEEDEGERE